MYVNRNGPQFWRTTCGSSTLLVSENSVALRSGSMRVFHMKKDDSPSGESSFGLLIVSVLFWCGFFVGTVLLFVFGAGEALAAGCFFRFDFGNFGDDGGFVHDPISKLLCGFF